MNLSANTPTPHMPTAMLMILLPMEPVARIVPIGNYHCLKSGRSARGAKAAASHTGSLAGFDSIYDAAFRQAGVLRASDIREAFDWARSLSTLSVPKGHNTIILTNGGGVGVLATDACERSGIRLMGDTGRLRELFGPLIPDYGSTRNPIDLTGQGGIDSFRKPL